MKKHISTFRMLFAAILLVGLFVVVGVVSSQSPENAEADAALAPDAPSSLLFSYQGQLLDTSGDPITDPAVDMTFKLYDVAELGTACWTEDHTGGDAVDVEDGLFNVLLGQIAAMDTACLTGDVYLELVVEGETMSPRELLASVAYAAETSKLSDGAVALGSLEVSGPIRIETTAVPLTFKDSNATGEGSLWRMPVDGNYLRFDASQNGTDFSGYKPVLRLNPSGSINILTDLTVGGQVKAGYDEGEFTSYFGRTAIGSGGTSSTDWARFGHLDKEADPGGYAIMQNNLGRTIVNAAEGRPIEFRINNETHMTLNSNGSLSCEGLVEANLQTPDERRMDRTERFNQGDLLCWSAENERLELCDTANDRLIMAVADGNGKPIVMGAEPVKVLGPVVAGDILVSSDIPGYAMVNNDPKPGTVIAQALEDLGGEQGVIKAMIRKW